MRLATNAPGDWPAVYLEPADLARGKGALLSAVARTLGEAGFRLESPDHPFPLREGVIYADALLVRGEERWPLFVYPEAGLEVAQRYYTAEALLADRFPDYFPAVYYAPRPLEPLPRTELGDAALERGFVLQPTGAPRPGRYPVWRARAAGERFDRSPVWEAMAEVYRLLRGREWVGLGVVLVGLGVAGDWREAEELRRRLFLMPLSGPGGLSAALSYREDRGLRLHLHEANDPELFAPWWNWLLGYLERNFPKDAPPAAATSPAWTFWVELLQRVRTSPAEMVGALRLGEPASRPS